MIKTPFPGKLAQKPLYDGGQERERFIIMKKIPRMILGCTLAAALALTACSRSDPGSSGSMSTNMGGSSSQTGQAGQNAAYRTGLAS